MEPDFQRILEALPGQVLVLAPDGPRFTILAASDAYLRATLTERSEIIGRGVCEVFPDDPETEAVDEARTSFQRVVDERRPDAMGIHRHDVRRPEAERGGFEKRYLRPLSSPVLGDDGRVVCIIHQVDDVTEAVLHGDESAEFRAANLALRESGAALAHEISGHETTMRDLERSRLLLASSLEAQKDTILFSIDHDYRYLYFNKAHSDVMKFAYDADVQIGACVLDYISDEGDRVAAKQNYDRALAGESHTNVRVFGDVERAYYESFFNPILDDSGAIIGATGLARDITARKRAEEQLAQMTRLYATLSQVNQTIVRVKQPEELYPAICDLAVDYGEFTLAWIGLVDEGSGDVRPVAANGVDITNWPFETVNIRRGVTKNGLVATAIRSREPAITGDGQSDQKMRSVLGRLEGNDYHSIAAIPFGRREETVGVLVLESQRAGLFKEASEVGLLDEMGSDISFALDGMANEADRLRAEQAARESAANYDALFETTLVGIAQCEVIVDEQGLPCDFRYLKINDALERMTGIRKADVLGRTTREILRGFEDSEVDWMGVHGKVALTGEPIAFESYQEHVERYYSVYVYSPRKGQSIAMFNEITEAKRTEDALRESEEDFRTLAEAVPQIVWMTTPDGKNTYFNQQWVDYTGMTLEESYGDGWNIPFHPDDRQRAWDAWQRATQDDAVYSVECRLRRADGAYRWWLIRGAPLRDENGTILKWFGTCTDIEEIKQTEHDLQQSQALLQAAMDRSQAGIAIADAPDGRLRYVNQAGLFIRGGSEAEVVDQVDAASYVASWRILHHDGTPYAPDEVPLARAVLYGETSEAEFIICRDDHENRIVLARAAPIHDDEGVVTAGVVVFHDITERKQAEDEVRRLNAELEQRVVARTAQLEATNRELEAFAYSVSHDLRAPLRAIDGFSAMVAEDAAEHLTAADVEHLQRVRNAAQRMGLLIDDLLGLSRTARKDLTVTSVDLTGLAEEVSAELRREQPEREVDLVIAPHLRADADPALLRMILVNLLDNAWKFTSKHETARVEVGAREVDGECVFFVRDDGAGFDTRHARKLFGAFERMHSPGEFEGTGIGLATVQRLVTRHGGRIWAEAEVEKGATFYFTLPGNGTAPA